MSNYMYHGGNNMPAAQHQQLTPLANLPTRPYQNNSPGPTNILPPIQSQVNGFSYPPFTRTESGSMQTPQHAPTSEPPMPLNRAAAYPNSSQPPLVSQAPVPTSQPAAYSQMPQQTYGAPSQHQVGSAAQAHPGINGSVYGPISLPSIQQSGFDSYRGTNPPLDYANQAASTSMNDMQGAAAARQPPVVGSQGRRGVLPSTMGRAPMAGAEGPSRANINPQKNQDGKYPCPFCPKTYLHLKHLKRHLLRHTGERPYQCYLCSETFCRSDILKRHFQKCEVRRGNPTNATHLTHAQAHLRKNNPVAMHHVPHAGNEVAGSALNGASMNGNSINGTAMDGNVGRPWANGPVAYMPYGNEAMQARIGADGATHDSSRGSSIMRPASRNFEENKRLSGVGSFHSIHNSADGSPSSSVAHEDRKPPNPLYQPREPIAATQQPQEATSVPSFAGNPIKTETASQAPYVHGRTAYAPYAGHHNSHMPGQEWPNFFQPGHDPMFSSTA